MPQVILLRDSIYDVETSTIQTYSSNTITQVADSFNDSRSIISATSFGDFNYTVIINANSVDSTEAFGTSQLNLSISFDSIESSLTIGTAQLNQFISANPLETSESFGTSRFTLNLLPTSVTTTNDFGTSQLNFIFYPTSLESTIGFGEDQLNMNIKDVPFPSIESTLVIPSPRMAYVVRPLSINTTVNFGVPQFIDNIHRVLVFKDGNITKMGENDAGIIAGQIRLNPASTVSNTASFGSADLPSNPEGFLSINIAGRDYRIPYYNT
jgi:hypothetical protein